jgi:threonylcarbamoyladenosine tRNA methylthiotransferase MtaB
MHGFTDNYIRVAAKYDPLLIYDMKKVVIEFINDKGLAEVRESEYTVFVH